MEDLQSKLNYVRDRLKEKVHHPFIAKYIGDPDIDDHKLLFLVSILDSVEMPLEKLANYSVSTMLIQLALDTHEKVTNSIDGESNQLNRQLTVLAGTYYSGFYYKLLADQNDIEAIRILAEGVETVNDQKIIAYQKDVESIDELMNSVKKIECGLLDRLTEHFQVNNWDDLVSNFLLINRLQLEKENFKKYHKSVVFDCLAKFAFHKNDSLSKVLSCEQQEYLVSICDRYIEISKQGLILAKSKIPLLNKVVDERIQCLLNLHQPVAK